MFKVLPGMGGIPGQRQKTSMAAKRLLRRHALRQYPPRTDPTAMNLSMPMAIKPIAM